MFFVLYKLLTEYIIINIISVRLRKIRPGKTDRRKYDITGIYFNGIDTGNY